MGPCASKSKKKPAHQPAPPVSEPPRLLNPEPVPVDPLPASHQPEKSPLKPAASPLKPAPSAHETPLKPPRSEGNVESSGLKDARREEDEPGNALAKHEPQANSELKTGSHFYYKNQEQEGQKLAERNLEFEEHEFKEPTDVKTSLHSNQLNRREIFSEVNKNKFLQSRNTGDSDEPAEMRVE